MTTQWTPETIRALGATTDLPTLGSILGVSRWKAYKMAQAGEWEEVGIRILPIGTKYRVAVQSILEVLGYSNPAGTGTSHDPAAPPDEGADKGAGDRITTNPSRPVAARGRP